MHRAFRELLTFGHFYSRSHRRKNSVRACRIVQQLAGSCTRFVERDVSRPIVRSVSGEKSWVAQAIRFSLSSGIFGHSYLLCWALLLPKLRDSVSIHPVVDITEQFPPLSFGPRFCRSSHRSVCLFCRVSMTTLSLADVDLSLWQCKKISNSCLCFKQVAHVRGSQDGGSCALLFRLSN